MFRARPGIICIVYRVTFEPLSTASEDRSLSCKTYKRTREHGSLKFSFRRMDEQLLGKAPVGVYALGARNVDAIRIDGRDLELVDGPCVSVEEHTEAVLKHLLGLLLAQRRVSALGGFPQQRLGKVGAETGGDGGRSVGGAEQIDVAEDAAVLKP